MRNKISKKYKRKLNSILKQMAFLKEFDVFEDKNIVLKYSTGINSLCSKKEKREEAKLLSKAMQNGSLKNYKKFTKKSPMTEIKNKDSE